MCVKLPLRDLNSGPYPRHPTSTYTCGFVAGDGNFAPLLPALPHASFPRLEKVVGRGGDEFRLFKPTLPRLSLPPPCPALLRVIIVNFSYSKTLLFKQTY